MITIITFTVDDGERSPELDGEFRIVLDPNGLPGFAEHAHVSILAERLDKDALGCASWRETASGFNALNFPGWVISMLIDRIAAGSPRTDGNRRFYELGTLEHPRPIVDDERQSYVSPRRRR